MKIIILDRDGVINFDSDEYIKSPDEWIPIPHSLEAIARLNRAGYKVVVATNQSGISRGYYTLDTLQLIHAKMAAALEAVGGQVDDIFFCPHLPSDQCACRKPQPGLLQQIQAKYQINLAETYFIGDSIRDVQAAQAVGCQPILVLTGNGRKFLAEHPELNAIPCFDDLAAAAAFITREESSYQRN